MGIITAPLSHSLYQLSVTIRDRRHVLSALDIQLISPDALSSNELSTALQMFKSLRATLGHWSDPDERYSASSSHVEFSPVCTHPTKARAIFPRRKDIEVRVGKLPDASFIHIPRSALNACPVLRARLIQGCRITNTDAVIFQIILDYLGSSGLLRRLQANARNPLTQLTSSSGMMLNLAKAWHLADMLDDVRLQNKLIDTYRTFYLKLLHARAKPPLEHEPFKYLEDHIGTHTKIEKFMIDFFAGLIRFSGDFSAAELLPFRPDVVQALKLRRAQLVVLRSSEDMIATGSICFNVSRADDTRHTTLHIVMPTRVPSSTDLSSSSSQRGCSTSAPSYTSSHPMALRAPNSVASLICGRGHRVRLSLPEITSLNGRPEVLVSRALVPTLQKTSSIAVRPFHTHSVSLMASLMGYGSVTRRQVIDLDAGDDSSDDDTVYDLFPPRLPPLPYDISQLFGPSMMSEK
jgi:hypothetical protein